MMDNEIEYRASGAPEVRDLNGLIELNGYAAVFDAWSDDLGGFVERIMPGFFADVLSDDVRGLWQHDPSYVLGRTTNSTLELVEDEIGLRYRMVPPDTQWARDAVTSIRRGDVNQTSFGFQVAEESWEPQPNGPARRTLIRARRLYDVSPVTFPAYPQTTTAVRGKVAELRAQNQPGNEPTGDHRGRDENLRAWYELKQLEVSNNE